MGLAVRGLIDPLVSISADQVCCDLNGEAVILNLNSGTYYGLDGIGPRVWDLIQEPKRTSAVVGTLIQEFEVKPEVCEQDVVALLGKLAEAGLVELRA